MSLIDQTIGPRQGWQCPLCRRVYSPDTPTCYSCVPEAGTSTTGTSIADALEKLGFGNDPATRKAQKDLADAFTLQPWKGKSS